MESIANIIGVLSDTHDQVHYLVKAIEYFNQKEVKLVIHCGDWVSPFTLKHYVKLQAPLHGVFGNNDGDKLQHRSYAKKYNINIHVEDQLLILTEFKRKIAVYHGNHQEIVDALVRCGDYDVVFHGHNHQPMVEKIGNVVSLNPGTLVEYTNENTHGASLGLYDADLHEGKIIWMKDILDS